jgi:hypothetical protein
MDVQPEPDWSEEEEARLGVEESSQRGMAEHAAANHTAAANEIAGARVRR